MTEQFQTQTTQLPAETPKRMRMNQVASPMRSRSVKRHTADLEKKEMTNRRVGDHGELTTEMLLRRFMKHQETRLRSTTFERLGGILRTLAANLPREADAITRDVVAEYIRSRSQLVGSGTVLKEISTLRRCLRLAVDWGLLRENAASRARLPKLPPARTRCLTKEEFQGALEIAPSWLRAPMMFAVWTGIPRGEMLSLKWADVDLAKRCAFVRELRSDKRLPLPLSSPAIRVLQSLPKGKPSDPVFAGVEAGRLSVTTRRLFQRQGVMDASFNTLRHTSTVWTAE